MGYRTQQVKPVLHCSDGNFAYWRRKYVKIHVFFHCDNLPYSTICNPNLQKDLKTMMKPCKEILILMLSSAVSIQRRSWKC